MAHYAADCWDAHNSTGWVDCVGCGRAAYDLSVRQLELVIRKSSVKLSRSPKRKLRNGTRNLWANRLSQVVGTIEEYVESFDQEAPMKLKKENWLKGEVFLLHIQLILRLFTGTLLSKLGRRIFCKLTSELLTIERKKCESSLNQVNLTIKRRISVSLI